GALILLEVIESFLRSLLRIRSVVTREVERFSEIAADDERQRGGRTLLGAAVWIRDEKLRRFAEADHGGRGELEMEAAESGDDARRHLQRFARLRLRFPVRSNRFRRNEHAHRNHIFEGIALAPESRAHLNARDADRFRDRVEARFARRIRFDTDSRTLRTGEFDDLWVEAL